MAHAFNPSAQEAQAGGALRVRSQSALHRKFQESQGCIERLSLERKKMRERKEKKLTPEDDMLSCIPRMNLNRSPTIRILFLNKRPFKFQIAHRSE